MKFTPKEKSKNHNVSDESVTKRSFEIIVSFAVVVALSIFLLSASVDLVARVAPIGFGRTVGNALQGKFMKDLDQGFDVSAQQTRVDAIFAKLRQNLEEDFESFEAVVVANRAVENAFALPGGQVVITSSLMELCSTDNEIAMILAHELGHQSNRDYLRGMGRGIVLTFAFWLIGDNGGFDVAQSLNQLLALNFSRKQEKAADQFALELLYRTYGSVTGALSVYTVFEQLQKKQMLSGLEFELFSTHPQPKKRIKFLRDYTKSKGWPID